MMEWTYESKPTSEFIKLPDGAIINVAHVRAVAHTDEEYVYIDIGWNSNEQMQDPCEHYDPDGKIYAWFAERSVEVGGE